MNIQLNAVKLKFIRNINPYSYYFTFCLSIVLIKFLINELILTETVLYNSYIEYISYEKISELANIISKLEWITYALVPIIYIIRFSIIASILAIGGFLMDYKIEFRKLFQVAMFAELVFLLPYLGKLLWFSFFEQAKNIKQVGSFEILSILSLFKDEEIYAWLKYPFSIANIFELAYWLLLAAGIKYHTNFSYNKSLAFVLKTYLPALFLWCVFVVFLSLSLN